MATPVTENRCSCGYMVYHECGRALFSSSQRQLSHLSRFIVLEAVYPRADRWKTGVPQSGFLGHCVYTVLWKSLSECL